ncbi:MAG: hypothetical protein KF752_14575 [Pirellulaceae bacterium]|nr:hypothetical protein [Pirellulaceae bacterium]
MSPAPTPHPLNLDHRAGGKDTAVCCAGTIAGVTSQELVTDLFLAVHDIELTNPRVPGLFVQRLIMPAFDR